MNEVKSDIFKGLIKSGKFRNSLLSAGAVYFPSDDVIRSFSGTEHEQLVSFIVNYKFEREDETSKVIRSVVLNHFEAKTPLAKTCSPSMSGKVFSRVKEESMTFIDDVEVEPLGELNRYHIQGILLTPVQISQLQEIMRSGRLREPYLSIAEVTRTLDALRTLNNEYLDRYMETIDKQNMTRSYLEETVQYIRNNAKRPLEHISGTLYITNGVTQFPYTFDTLSTFEDLESFIDSRIRVIALNNRLSSIIYAGRRLSADDFQTAGDWESYNNKTLSFVSEPILNTPEKLATYVLEQRSGIEKISADKPVASLNSGQYVGIVNDNIRDFFTSTDVKKYLLLLSTEKSGPIANAANGYYIYYSEKYARLLARAANLSFDEFQQKLVAHAESADDLSLIYIAFGDITGLSRGFRKTENDLTPLGRSILRKYRELVRQNQ